MIYDKLVGFAGFGFPKSHAAAFGAARVPVGLAAAVLPGRVPLRAHERAADGLLPAVVARARRAAARGGGAAAARRTARRRSARSRTAPCASGSATCSRSARTTRETLEAGQPYADLGDLARRVDGEEGRARGARRRRRVRRLGAAAAAALAARRDRPRRDGRRRQPPARAAARADGGDARPARADRRGSGCSPTTSTRRSRSASIRCSCCARICRPAVTTSAELARDAERDADRAGGDGDRAPAAVDGERHRLHAARGRARPGEPDRPAARCTSATGRSSAASRCCSRAASSSGTAATSTCSSPRSSPSARSPARQRVRQRSLASRARTTSVTARQFEPGSCQERPCPTWDSALRNGCHQTGLDARCPVGHARTPPVRREAGAARSGSRAPTGCTPS